MSISAEYNGDHLTPEQIELLHAGLEADLAEFATTDAEAEPEAEPEPLSDPEPEMEIEP